MVAAYWLSVPLGSASVKVTPAAASRSLARPVLERLGFVKSAGAESTSTLAPADNKLPLPSKGRGRHSFPAKFR
jgi:hypothetical protein